MIYHVSPQYKVNGMVLTPRVPSNYYTENGYEDDTIKRISFSESINGALAALHNVSDGDIVHVYTTDNTSRVVPNKDIQQYVPDAKYTQEVWITHPVRVKYYKSIVVIQPKQKGEGYDRPLKFEYAPNKVAEFWYWDHEDITVLSHV